MNILTITILLTTFKMSQSCVATRPTPKPTEPLPDDPTPAPGEPTPAPPTEEPETPPPDEMGCAACSKDTAPAIMESIGSKEFTSDTVAMVDECVVRTVVCTGNQGDPVLIEYNRGDNGVKDGLTEVEDTIECNEDGEWIKFGKVITEIECIAI